MATFKIFSPALRCPKVIVIKPQEVMDLYSVHVDNQEPHLFDGRIAAQSFVFRMIEAYCEVYGTIRIRKSFVSELDHKTAQP